MHELFVERLAPFSIEDYAAKWDELRAQVDSALERSKLWALSQWKPTE